MVVEITSEFVDVRTCCRMLKNYHRLSAKQLTHTMLCYIPDLAKQSGFSIKIMQWNHWKTCSEAGIHKEKNESIIALKT